MKPKRLSLAPERPKKVTAYLGLAILIALEGAWTVFWTWASVISNTHWLVFAAVLLGGGSMIACYFVFIHGFYLMYGLLPVIDEHLDPHLAAYTRERGDPLFWRIHRVLLYGMSLASGWAHRRMEYRDYDFRGLPLSLRLPLLVECYVLYGGLLAGMLAFGLLELTDHLGLTHPPM